MEPNEDNETMEISERNRRRAGGVPWSYLEDVLAEIGAQETERGAQYVGHSGTLHGDRGAWDRLKRNTDATSF